MGMAGGERTREVRTVLPAAAAGDNDDLSSGGVTVTPAPLLAAGDCRVGDCCLVTPTL